MIPFRLSDVPLISWYIGVLIILEGLLSADNALVLAVMVRHLPKAEQRSVLRWGLWGAVGFRFVAVLLSAILLKLWYCKVLGGAYLLYLAIKHFVQGESGAEAGRRGWSDTFWGTVLAVTFADIAFSIDSIVAAVGMADELPRRFGYNGKLFIVFTGGVLGIITMRFVVRYFVILLERFPGLTSGAYVLVAWIGLKLILSGLEDAKFTDLEIPDWLFWSGMGAIAILSLLIRPRSRPPEMTEGMRLLEEEEASDGDDSQNGSVGPEQLERMQAHIDAPADRPRGQSG
jgi:YkoY family integral membrane protein